MISHGTLTSLDLQESRRFYEEVFGFEVIQLSPVSLLARKGSDHTYVVVETGQPSSMTIMDHNGIDVASRAEVDRAHAALRQRRERYGIQRINRVMDQHGVYSFYFADRDGNTWEIVHNPDRGYTYLFDERRDLTGRTDIDPDLMEHVADDQFFARLRATGTARS
ncbi:VOC family protein [Parafrankia sp. EUN1f]|uniref:VOC family protein n=1 Tax=Parafrankia sp. EUN1f TaxID=102897 RepID=UPI0012F8A1D2|nr:VOC family protein [Parafrankia sp. EUN1f]